MSMFLELLKNAETYGDFKNVLLNEIKPSIEKYLEKYLPEGNTVVYEGIKYALLSGGKRLRPALCLITAEALGGDVEKLIPAAVACEVLHNMLLVHDDIMDGDVMRRGKPTVWKRFGIPHAINIGDRMLVLTYELLMNTDFSPETKLKLVEITNETFTKTIEGQSIEEELKEKDFVSEKMYLDMISKKTGYYLTYPMVVAAVCTGNEDIIDAIWKYGMNIGPAFQIRDDMIDLTSGKGRDTIGNDIKEGKRSIFVVRVMETGNPEDISRMVEILNKPREETTQEDINEVLDIFEKYGVYEYAEELEEKLLKNALKAIEQFPENARYVFTRIAEFVVRREV